MVSRRQFLGAMSWPSAAAACGWAVGAADLARGSALAAGPLRRSGGAVDLAQDEDYWSQVRRAFSAEPGIINLNSGGVSPSPVPVQEAIKRYLDFSNMSPTYSMWRILETQREQVRERMARERGIPVIVDGAHTLAHFDFKLPELDCDYYATSLHKWLFAPHGTGLSISPSVFTTMEELDRFCDAISAAIRHGIAAA